MSSSAKSDKAFALTGGPSAPDIADIKVDAQTTKEDVTARITQKQHDAPLILAVVIAVFCTILIGIVMMNVWEPGHSKVLKSICFCLVIAGCFAGVYGTALHSQRKSMFAVLKHVEEIYMPLVKALDSANSFMLTQQNLVARLRGEQEAFMSRPTVYGPSSARF